MRDSVADVGQLCNFTKQELSMVTDKMLFVGSVLRVIFWNAIPVVLTVLVQDFLGLVLRHSYNFRHRTGSMQN